MISVGCLVIVSACGCGNGLYPNPFQTIRRATYLGSGIPKESVEKRVAKRFNCWWEKRDSIERCMYILRRRAFSSKCELVWIEYCHDTTTGLYYVDTVTGPPLIGPRRVAN